MLDGKLQLARIYSCELLNTAIIGNETKFWDF